MSSFAIPPIQPLSLQSPSAVNLSIVQHQQSVHDENLNAAQNSTGAQSGRRLPPRIQPGLPSPTIPLPFRAAPIPLPTLPQEAMRPS